MFTGLVQAVGAIVAVRPLEAGVRIEIDARGLAPRRVGVGDSIAVNGACLTATALDGYRFAADVSAETLSKTAGLDRCHAVNLETSLALSEPLGGHLVTGHVDAVGAVLACTPRGESVELVVQVPGSIARLLAVKGSVAVDGVSLTVNAVEDLPGGPDEGCRISINLIPHTLAATTLKELAPGAKVNLEADLVARYVARWMAPA